MGANDDVRTFKAPNLKAAIKMAAEILNEDRYENGHSYSGSIGMADGVTPAVQHAPVSEKKANELLFGTSVNDWNGLAQKWGPAVLIQINAPKGSGRGRTWMLGAVCSS